MGCSHGQFTTDSPHLHSATLVIRGIPQYWIDLLCLSQSAQCPIKSRQKGPNPNSSYILWLRCGPCLFDRQGLFYNSRIILCIPCRCLQGFYHGFTRTVPHLKILPAFLLNVLQILHKSTNSKQNIKHKQRKFTFVGIDGLVGGQLPKILFFYFVSTAPLLQWELVRVVPPCDGDWCRRRCNGKGRI